MSMGDNPLARYRVDPEAGIRLENSDTAQTGGLTREQARSELAELNEQIADLQARLYAEEECAMLVVLQGIDAAGKDTSSRPTTSGSGATGTPTRR